MGGTRARRVAATLKSISETVFVDRYNATRIRKALKDLKDPDRSDWAYITQCIRLGVVHVTVTPEATLLTVAWVPVGHRIEQRSSCSHSIYTECECGEKFYGPGYTETDTLWRDHARSVDVT